MLLVEKLMARSKTRKFIHPAYRQLVLRKQRLCRRAKRNIPTAKKLLDRAIHYSPIPCVQPFLCQQCGLASCDLSTVLEHNCGRKIGGLAEYTNWQRIVSHGYRSKAKDALAVLETIPFPQKARIKKTPIKHHEEVVDGPVESVLNPKSLLDCAFSVLEKTQFQQQPEIIQLDKPRRVQTRQFLVKDNCYGGPKRIGYYCHGCKKIFQPYYAYDEHLEEDTICGQCPDPEEVDITSQFSLNGFVIEPTVLPMPKMDLVCTRCKQSNFETREHFHEHLFQCSRNPEFDTDEDPVQTDTLEEESEAGST
uniref:Recombination activating protein 1 n=1 Tax=Panagrolaimus sp. JU765 TaxID=591449 RepID=A0AC34QMU9_9BILA